MELAEAIIKSRDDQVEVVYDTGERERLHIETALLGNGAFAAVLNPGDDGLPYTLFYDLDSTTTPAGTVPLYQSAELATQVQDGNYPDLSNQEPVRSCRITGTQQMDPDTLTAHEARRTLYEIMRGDASFEAKAQDALELGERYLGADNGHLTRIDPETKHWEATVSTDLSDGEFPTGLELNLETTYCRRTIEAENPIALHDAPNQGWADDPAFEAHGLHCYHGTTLMLDEEPYGTVCFVSKEPRAEPYSTGETLFAELIAHMLERELESDRQTNLAVVLNRVLRHNLRSNVSDVRDYTQLMTEESDNEALGEKSLRNIDQHIELGQKARELGQVVATDSESTPTDIVALVRELAEERQQEHPHASLSVVADDQVTAEILPSFERAIVELLENAVKHSGDAPTIRIAIEPVPNAVTIQIADDSPGLADHEVDVFSDGPETALSHGSGLGLWLARWIVTSHDGTIEATETTDGTSIAVTIPKQRMANSQEQLATLTRLRDQYKAAFEEASDGITITDTDGRILDANTEAAQIYGLDRKQLLGRDVGEFLSDACDFDATLERLQTDMTEYEDISIQTAGGQARTIECTTRTNFVPGQHLIVSRDVTERKEREQALRNRTRQLQEGPKNIDAAVWIRGDKNQYELVNQRFRDLFQVDADVEISGTDASEILPSAVAEQFRENEQRVYETHEPVELEEAVETDDGHRQYLTRITPIIDGETVTGACGIAVDITDQIERGQALAEATQRLESVIEVTPEPIVVLDEDGHIDEWNDAARQVFGYTRQEVLGERLQSLDLVEEHDESAFQERFERVLAGETIRGLDVKRQQKDGTTIHLEVSATPLKDSSGTVTGMVVAAKDVTEKTVRVKSLEQYESAFKKAGDGMTITDDEGRIQEVNAEAARIYGEPKDQLLGRSMREFLPNEFDFEAEWGEIQAANMKRDEMPILSADGGTHSIEYTAKSNFRQGQHLIVSRDITDRKEHERELESQVERLGEFARVLSHDLRNPLSVAQSRLELASAESDSEHFDSIERAHTRMESLIDDMLTLAREESHTPDIERVSLPEMVTSCWANVETRGATLDTKIHRTIQADENRLKQLLENLIRNAVEHGGEDVTVTVGQQDGGFYVEDDGDGIPPDNRTKVLEDGYSSQQEGTGFGLTIVKQAVEAHGWEISVTEAAGGGARFEITSIESEHD